jgi:hypothetical protein
MMNTPVVLITGALTGIGRATALAFAQEGARIVVSGRRDEEGTALASELRGVGVEAEFIRADVRHEDEVSRLVDQTVERFGRLDVAVNNAGTEGKPGPVTEQSTESYAATFDTNVLGTVLSMKHELRVMQNQGHGSIVNLSSTMGHKAAPGASIYIASKHAVEGRPHQRGSPWPHRNRDVEPFHRQRRQKGLDDRGRSTQARRSAGGSCESHRLSHVRQGFVRHRSNRFGRWREVSPVNRLHVQLRRPGVSRCQ